MNDPNAPDSTNPPPPREDEATAEGAPHRDAETAETEAEDETLSYDAARLSGWRGWMQRLRFGFEPDHAEADREESEMATLIEEIARWVTSRRLETPAILFLETHRPLASLAGHSLVFATPLMAPLFGMSRMEHLQRLMEKSANVDRLINRIEELAEAR